MLMRDSCCIVCIVMVITVVVTGYILLSVDNRDNDSRYQK